MKKHINYIVICSLLIAAGCKQDVITLETPAPPTPVTPSKGNADFTKYVSIGNSLTAGFQAGALFTEGQQNSFPSILAKQFQTVGGSTTFNQPDINSVNGYNASFSDPTHGVILGRMILFSTTGNASDARPTPANYPGVPAPYNSADLPTPYTGDKSKLNNFGVPGIILAQVLTPATGGPSVGNPAYNPLYARFASNPSADGVTGSTILSDAIGAQPTFFTFDLGNNDVLGYATTGGDGSIHLTTTADFQNYYNAAIAALLNPNTNPNKPKGAVATIPDVTTIPFFYTVPWNAIPLEQAEAADINTELAVGYNAFLDGMAANHFITTAEAAKRKLTFQSGQNAILISDTDLTNLAPYMQGPYAALAPYALARQTTSSDLVTLTAGSVLGTLVNNDPAQIYGVTVPMKDKYILVPSEIDSIEQATAAFNTTIKTIGTTYPDQIAVADVNAVFKNLVTSRFMVSDGVTIDPSFAPPFGAFSEDGVHPNSRGYAFLANIFIDAINAKFGATIPKAPLSGYKGVGLPVVILQ